MVVRCELTSWQAVGLLGDRLAVPVFLLDDSLFVHRFVGRLINSISLYVSGS